MDNCTVLGVVLQDGPAPMLVYLNQPVPATPEVLAMSAPLKPTEVFRLSATCAEHKCPHFDGTDCRLATRIVQILPAAVDTLPPCIIRKDCRWYAQEGGAACKRCPEITTVTYDLSPQTQEVSGLPVMTEGIAFRPHKNRALRVDKRLIPASNLDRAKTVLVELRTLSTIARQLVKLTGAANEWHENNHGFASMLPGHDPGRHL